MLERVQENAYRKHLICIDSYSKGVPEGRIYNSCQEVEVFESLSQFLIKMETLLDTLQMPQAYTATRTFPTMMAQIRSQPTPLRTRRGSEATFELQVVFRQHTSWQGVIIWKEQNLEQSFSSVLELVLLMDSALRSVKWRDYA